VPGETILLVDDEEADRGLMHGILARQGYEVLEAMDYSSAWIVFKNNRERITLLVTDVSLPSANGCELFKALIQDKPDLRVLFVSGFVGAEICRTYGVFTSELFFLRKPFRPEELLARVQAVLESSGPFPAAFASPA
jgi:DNA-binding response OmpR family regulator